MLSLAASHSEKNYNSSHSLLKGAIMHLVTLLGYQKPLNSAPVSTGGPYPQPQTLLPVMLLQCVYIAGELKQLRRCGTISSQTVE